MASSPTAVAARPATAAADRAAGRHAASLLAAALVVATSACQLGDGEPSPGSPDAQRASDLHSHARPDEVAVTHASLDLDLDFATSQVLGRVTLRLARHDASAPLWLDTRDLHIEAATGADGEPRAFELGATDPILGAPLRVDLEPGDDRIELRYRTHPGAAALQWLTPDQTAGGAAPFLYTQGQAILTRSWIPLQDSPGVRITYDARVKAPAGLTVLMAAAARGRDAGGAFAFEMPQPIPPYLVALACGDLERRELSARCAVWAEPPVADAAAAELEDMPAMLAACERLFGPYRWDRYDVLILPPAFPFGGMENPRLTFATPTILAGDKSLVALIAHELAHSWSGNLVTNATWRDFWLNEGFTVYLEQRIMEEVFGLERARMEIANSLHDLEAELATLPAAEQVLHIDLAGRNPDDGMTAVPYDKGAAFLRVLEHRFGRAALDGFLARYFDEHAFQSVTTAQFVAYLEQHLLAAHPVEATGLEVERWIYEPGLPPDVPRPRSAALVRAAAAAERWRAGAPAADLTATAAAWTTQEWLHFLARLDGDGASSQRLAELDAAFDLTSSRNSEVLAAWLELAIRHGYTAADAALESFLLRVGRRKFLKPLYQALVAADPARAQALYRRARPRYHAVSRRTLDDLVLGGAPR